MNSVKNSATSKPEPRGALHLLIIGAGPYGLSLAAYAAHHHLEHVVVGRPMEFWKQNMPPGMFLRSPLEWHIDPLGVHTFARYVEVHGFDTSSLVPLPIQMALDYFSWFQAQKGIVVAETYVQRLDHEGGTYRATLDDHSVIRARNVVVATGIKYFSHTPPELAGLLPAGRFTHTSGLVEFSRLAGRRCLIIGGRQSAFEWAALLKEDRASEVHVAYRHETPAFSESDWAWVPELADNTVRQPGWFRSLPGAEQEALHHRFWTEGRRKLEPWLAGRVARPGITLWPGSKAVQCDLLPDGGLRVSLDTGAALLVDHVVLATGYQVDIRRVPFLAEGNILESLRCDDGVPVLDEHFQADLPGLFFTGLAASKGFGPIFGFLLGCPASARIIGDYLGER